MCQLASHFQRGMPSNRWKLEINMNSVLALAGIVLVLATSVAAARAETVVRFPPKGGIPYAVQVPDRPNATARGNSLSRGKTIEYGSGRVERRNGRWVVKPNR